MKKFLICFLMLFVVGCSQQQTVPVYIQPDFQVEELPYIDLSMFPPGMTDDMFTEREKQLIDNLCILASYSERQYNILVKISERGKQHNQAMAEYTNSLSFRSFRNGMSYDNKVRILKSLSGSRAYKPTAEVYQQRYVSQPYYYQRTTTQPLPRGQVYVKENELYRR